MLNLMFLFRFEIPNNQGWQSVMTQAQKMKVIHPAFQDLKMFSVMITFMTHTRNLWKVVTMMKYKHEKLSLQL